MDNTSLSESQERRNAAVQADRAARRRQREAFSAHWDDAWMSGLFERLLRGGLVPGTRLIGEGFHFRAYLVGEGLPQPLVIRIAKPSFGEGLTANRQRWAKAMQRARAAEVTLVPPFRIMWSVDDMAIVTPYYPDPVAPGTAYQELVAGLEAGLLALGLEVTDRYHLRSREGVIYLVDWSDLREKPRRR